MLKLPLLASAALLISLSASAQDHHNIVVSSPSLPEWKKAAQRNLNESLHNIHLRGREGGATIVRFKCSHDGKPREVASIYRRGQGMERVGLKTVQGMKSLHPAFTGHSEDQVYEAVIVVGASEDDVARKMANALRVSDSNRRQMARANPSAPMAITLAVAGM